MNRYIDADAYIAKAKYEAQAMPSDCGFAEYTEWLLDKTPSIDIVRCKECAYWQPYENNPDIKVCTRNYRMSFARYPEDYCSRGERKESE